MLRLKYVFSLFFLLFVLTFNTYGIIILEKTDNSEFIRDFYIAYDTSGATTIERVLSGDSDLSFTHNASGEVNFGYGKEFVWLKLVLQSEAEERKDWSFKISFPNLDNIQFYQTKGNEVVFHSLGGIYNKEDDYNLSSDPNFYFTTEGQAIYTFYLKIHSSSILIFPITISPNKNEVRAQSLYYFMDFFFFGILLGFVLYNFALIFLVRERAYLFLSLYLFMLLGIFLFLYGYTDWLKDFASFSFFVKTRFLCSAFIHLFVAFYLIDFFRIRRWSLAFYLLTGMIAFQIFYTLFLVLGANLIYMNMIALGTFPFFLLSNLFISFFLYRQGKRQAISFFIAYSLLVIAVIVYTLMMFRVFRYSPVLFRVPLMASGIHAILLTFGLSAEMNEAREANKRSVFLSIQNKLLRTQVRRRRILERKLRTIYRSQEKVIRERSAKIVSEYVRFQTLVENLGEWVWQVTLDGEFIYSSPYGEKISGYQEDELEPIAFCQLFEKQKQEYLALMMEESITEARPFYISDIELVNKSGGRIPVEVSGKALYNYNKELIGFIGFIRDISDRLAAEKKVSRAILNTEEKERKRFSLELHDGLSPVLSGIKLYLSSLQSANLSGERYQEVVTSLNEYINWALTEVRQIANKLLPVELDCMGLKLGLESFIERMSAHMTIKIHFSVKGDDTAIDDESQLVIYRSLSELLNNSLKHSGADNIYIDVELTKQIKIHYRDDGQGFDYENRMKHAAGIGLKSIPIRIKMIGGELECITSPGAGVEYNILIGRGDS